MSDDERFMVRLIDGKLYDPWSPSGEPPSPETVAHGLARLCRYGGHVRRDNGIYSVAEHCLWIALYLACEGTNNYEFCQTADDLAAGEGVEWGRITKKRDAYSALLGLIHDAPEGCGLVDVCGPALRHKEMDEYRRAHDRCQAWLRLGWRIAKPESEARIKDVDRAILGAEMAIRPVVFGERRGGGEDLPPWPNLDLAGRHNLSRHGIDYVAARWVSAFKQLKGML